MNSVTLNRLLFFDVIAVVVIAVSGGSRGGAGGTRPTPLFLDQTKARRAEKKKIKKALPPSPLPPPLFDGLDQPLAFA